MAETSTLEQLADRLARLEQEVAAAKLVADPQTAVGAADNDLVGRRHILKMAGLAAAAGAGALLVKGETASAADGGNAILGHSGDTLNPNLAEHPTEVQLDGSVTPTPRVILLGNDSGFAPGDAAYLAAVAGWGNTRNGVYGYSNSGDGVVGWTGGTAPAVGMKGIGQGTINPVAAPPAGTGVYGLGGATGNGPGVIGLGSGTTAIPSSSGWPFAGVGVYGVGGATSNGQGIIGIGGGTTGKGVIAFGAGWPNIAPGAYGLAAYGGSGSGAGAYAVGAFGVYALGGTVGVLGLGNGSGSTGVQGTGYGTGGVGGAFAGDGAGIDGTGVKCLGYGSGVAGAFSGGRAPINLSPAAAPGPPTTGAHSQGDVVVDSRGAVWVCVVSGTPGKFVPLQQGGIANAFYQAVSTLQYKLANSDGATWVDMDTTSATPLAVQVTPAFNCVAVLSVSSSLWTANAGYNQDIGIAVAGGAFPLVAGQPEGWEESGGFAGAFSPNAAYAEVALSLTAGTTYTIRLVWKTNKPAAGATIFAGAGPIGGKFSPTRLTVQLIVTA